MTASDPTKRFAGRRVLIVGDLVADQFLNGTISRVSREAPVFIVRHDETETRPGAAANTAANIASLGGQAILIGIVGDDENAELLLASLEANVATESIVRAFGTRTTTKVRVLAGQHYAARQQMIRIDYEGGKATDSETRAKFADHFEREAASADAIVLSDYGYGVVTPELFARARELATSRNIPLIVDSRFRLGDFAGATSATPNQDEVEHILGSGFSVADCERLRETLDLEALLITRGNKGMLLIEAGRQPVYIDAVGSSEPVDVTGAGDTVIAAYALGLAGGLNFAEAADIANQAGSIVVMKKGTATANAEELLSSIKEHSQTPQALPAN
ncbi:MAG: PfkB family carbohydrate kinase [Pyrinomonadaceae bacterium]